MKKAIVLSILGLAVSGFAAFGQGEITFANYLSASYEPIYYNPSQALAPAGMAGMNVNDPSVQFQVYWMLGDQTSMTVSSFLASATPNVNGPTTIDTTLTGGYVGGGPMGAAPGALGGPGGYVLPNTVDLPTWSSGVATFLIVGSGSGLTGNSGLFTSSDLVALGSPNNYMDNPAIVMSMVPEPTTLAFAGMGLLSLFALARRKKA